MWYGTTRPLRHRALGLATALLALALAPIAAGAPSGCPPGTLITTCSTAPSAPPGWPPDVPATLDPELQRLVDAFVEDRRGRYGIAVLHLPSRRAAAHQVDVVMPSASLYKLGVLYAAFHEQRAGRLDFDEVFTVDEWSMQHEGDQYLYLGRRLTAREAIQFMIARSDNTAARLLIRRIGRDRINALIERFGLREFRLDDTAQASPRDVLRLLLAIAQGRAVDVEASQAMVDLLLQQEIQDRIPRFLPFIPIAHKTGNLLDTAHDAGVIYAPAGPYILVAMSTGLPWDQVGVQAIAELSRDLYAHFHPGVRLVEREEAP